MDAGLRRQGGWRKAAWMPKIPAILEPLVAESRLDILELTE